MPGLIHELVNDASDATKPIGQMLRRMQVAAVRLGLDQLEAWVDHELNGYPDRKELPGYRVQVGVPMADHVMHGPQPLRGGSPEFRHQLSHWPILQSVGSIEDLLARDGDGEYWFPYPEPFATSTIEANGGFIRRVGLQLDRSRLVDIVDGVRGRILSWALSMEKAGVTGEGMSFSAEEQKAAQNVTNHTYFIGDNARQNINSTDNSTNTVVHGQVWGDLKSKIETEVTDPTEKSALVASVDDMQAQTTKGGFMAAYGRFMQSAANHVQVVEPFFKGLMDVMEGLAG